MIRWLVSGATCVTCSETIATMTARNDSPFSVKQKTVPSVASATPASSGPMTRARLNWIEFSAMAFGRSSFVRTSDGMSDW